MQRVSTAFVGQVSAASSPAVAKLKGRARATNDPAYVPLASSHRAQSRRRRDLVAIFLDALGGRAAVSELQLVQVRKAAELTTAAEAVSCSRARRRWTLSCSSRSRAKQGALVRALNPKTAAKRGPTFAEVVARIAAEEAAGRPGILHQWLSSLPSKPSKPGFEGFEGADP